MTFHLNHPNPFNPTTNITFQLAERGFVSLRVYDVLGREVATLIDDVVDRGVHSIAWDATGHPSGVYFYRLTANGFDQTRQLVLLR